jgi:hypothetical protein
MREGLSRVLRHLLEAFLDGAAVVRFTEHHERRHAT